MSSNADNANANEIIVKTDTDDVVDRAFKNFMSDEESVRFGLFMIHKSIVSPHFGFSKYISCKSLVSCCNYFSTDTFSML